MSQWILFACNDEGGASELDTRLVDWQLRKNATLLDEALVRRNPDGRAHAAHCR